MSSNVGLTTPRGSGTSGYVQRNLSNLRPRDREHGAPYPLDLDGARQQHRQRQPDAAILEHDRKSEVEVKVFGQLNLLLVKVPFLFFLFLFNCFFSS